ncbi:hypothetical protein EKK58_09210 [Candidatus Dependentiae bacterium]|nr:MAG: hypothetical protein EKK58_09210 [Candidatus Dependentiae bacterium]
MTTYLFHIKNLDVYLSDKASRHSGKMCRPYAFLIQKQSCSYIAFTKFRTFRLWLKERNLKLDGNKIIGEYFEQGIHPDKLAAIEGYNTYVMQNGEYRRAKIVYDKNRVATVYYEWTGFSRGEKEYTLEEHFRLDKIYC